MTDNADQTQTAAEDAPLCNSLPVELRFELAAINMRFGEVSTLTPGHVFELDKPLDRRLVTVYANGQAVAEGTLVAVGHLTGVRIERMLLPPRSLSLETTSDGGPAPDEAHAQASEH